MTIASNARLLQRTRQDTRRVIQLIFSGNYVTGGDNLDLTAISNALGIDGFKNFSRVPNSFEVLNGPAGYKIEIIKGATTALNLVKIFDIAAAAELAAAGYPAALSGATDVTVAFDLRQGV